MNDPARPLIFSYSAVWDDAARMLRANAGLLTAIAGVFLFLPALLLAYYVAEPDPSTGLAEWMESTRAYFRRAGIWLILASSAQVVGVISVYLLLLGNPRVTVGRAVATAVSILPFYFIVSFLRVFAVSIGFVLLILPAFYLLGKLTLASPILVAETPRAPISALRASWQRSKGRSIVIAGLLLLIFLMASLLMLAVQIGIGSLLLILTDREGVGGLLVAILEAATQSAYILVNITLIAAIYRSIPTGIELGKRTG